MKSAASVMTDLNYSTTDHASLPVAAAQTSTMSPKKHAFLALSIPTMRPLGRLKKMSGAASLKRLMCDAPTREDAQ
jgi:hypothetical protein